MHVSAPDSLTSGCSGLSFAHTTISALVLGLLHMHDCTFHVGWSISSIVLVFPRKFVIHTEKYSFQMP